MSLYSRLGLNFDTSKFGAASTLTAAANSTLGMIANSTGQIPQWQQTDLSSGPVNRSLYFKNPVTPYINTIITYAQSLYVAANSANDSNTSSAASNLIIELNSFQSHTNNISGVSVVSNTYFPSLQSAQSVGQLNMMTLARSDGVSNTTPILGSFTSLFISDQLQTNANVIIQYTSQYQNSLANVSGNLVSNLSNSQIATIISYLGNTQSLMSTRRTGDWAFYQNSLQLSQDIAFMQQFNGMGATMTYLVNNFVGTSTLINHLNGS